MLRIDLIQTAKSNVYLLEGQLTGAWVEELRSAWVNARPREVRVTEYVDLNEVTRVDAPGLHLLEVMHLAGVRFVAKAPYTVSLLEDLESTILPSLPDEKDEESLKRFRIQMGALVETIRSEPSVPRP